MAKEPLEALQDQVCPYCHEVFGTFTVEPVMLTDGDRVVALQATCSHCGTTAHLSPETLTPGMRYGVMHG